MEADLPPNLKIRIAGFSFRRRAAGNLTHIRLKLKKILNAGILHRLKSEKRQNV
jgi:hypothetical protein